MLASDIICVFLMSCFAELIPEPNDCPTDCHCYIAPKDGLYWNQNSKSLFCETVPNRGLLKNFDSINTIALKNKDVLNLEDKYFENLYINNIVLDGINKVPSSPPKIKPFTNINGLKVLTLINLDLMNFDWQAFKDKTSLNAIHIENCNLDALESNKFGPLSATKIISFTILSKIVPNNTKVNKIEINTFKDWKSLKMITIRDNLLKDMLWIEASLPELWSLDLRGNYIESIPANLLQSLPKLKALKLDDNNVKMLNWNFLEPLLLNLNEFSLLDNVLCPTKEILDIYRKLSLNTPYVANNIGKYPEFFRFSMKNMLCHPYPGSSMLCIQLFTGILPVLTINEENCKSFDRQKNI